MSESHGVINDKLISSIKRVASALSNHHRSSKVDRNSEKYKRLVEACTSWRERIVAYDLAMAKWSEEEQGKISKGINSICELTSIVYYKLLLPLSYVEAKDDEIPILSLIGKGRDENLHSDFIAALLETSETDRFGFELLARLANWKHESSPLDLKYKYQNVYRECRLDSISELVANEIADRRIDILVETDGHVLVIENKVDSSESDSQTADYYEVIEEAYSKSIARRYLLLSPYGYDGVHKSFKGMSYLDLHNLIVEVQKQNPLQSRKGKRLVEFYLNELRGTILVLQKSARISSYEYLKEKGHVV